MNCSDCRHWITHRVTDYEDGSRIFNIQSPEGKGQCQALSMETPADFGCNKFVEGHEHIEVMGKKTGSPWHHSHWGTCPECNGVGWQCRRCAGTGRVLYYDDGYIGEEQTRRHPNEVKGMQPAPPPTCLNCNRDLDPTWVACPHCGARTNKPEDPIRVDDLVSIDAGLEKLHEK